MDLRAAVLALVIGLTGCASLKTSEGGTAIVSKYLIAAVEFDHHCDREHITVVRLEYPTAELDVCGSLRRYKGFMGENNSQTWVDVTSLYPPSSLGGRRISPP